MGEKKDDKCCCRSGKKPRDPKECSEEQIRECHGEDKSHPCVKKCDDEGK